MANVYYLNNDNTQEEFDKNDENYQVASVLYVKELIKKVQDLIIAHEKSKDSHTESSNIYNEINLNESVDVLELPNTKIPENIDIESLNTDSNHKFISETQLAIMKDKPSSNELNAALMDLRNEFKVALNNYFNNLLNDKNALTKLKDIDYLIKNSDNLATLLESLSSKVSKEELNKHTESYLHLTNNDRKALNLLLGFIKEGCADWNATKEDPNYIRNKPESLPANGGNADTVGGYSSDSLLNHQLEDYIIGVNNFQYPINEVDTLLEENNAEEMDELIAKIKNITEGLYSFRAGIYYMNNLDLNMDSDTYGDIIIRGVGKHNTVFNTKNGTINGRVSIENLNLLKSTITINSYCTFDNIAFYDSTIYFKDCNETTIRNCVFKNCTVVFQSIMNSMFINNRVVNSGKFIYFGGNNLFGNNLVY